MAHQIFRIKGKDCMAYTGDQPWHRLGQKLEVGAPIEEWQKAAGFDFSINSSPVEYQAAGALWYSDSTKRVLYHSASLKPLAIVSDRYHVVQPIDVLEFFRDLIDHMGYQMETAGVLFDGQKYWAMANTGLAANILGKDRIESRLLVATSCDGSLKTSVRPTSVRVVCDNTLRAAGAYTKAKDACAVSVSHRTQWTPELAGKIKEKLNLKDNWSEFIDHARALAECKVTEAQALKFAVEVLGDPEKEYEPQYLDCKPVAMTLQLFNGLGRGSELKSSKGTAWGLLNAVTEYVDWYAGRDSDNRVVLSQFKGGAVTKNEAFAKAMEFVA